MNGWLLPAVTASFWAGLLAWPIARSTLGVWGSLALAAAAFVAAWLAAPSPRRRDPLAGAGLVRTPSAAVDAIAAPSAGAHPGAVPPSALVAVGVLFIGTAWAGLAEHRLSGSFLSDLSGQRATLEATIREEPRPTALGWRAVVDVRRATWRDGAVAVRERLWIAGDEAPPRIVRGDLVRIDARLEVPEDPGFRDAINAKGIAATARVDELERLGPSPNPFVRATQVVREVIGRSIASVFPEREAGLLLGLALGDDSQLDPGTERDFKATGLTHLLVVSGGNVAMILAPALALAGVLGLGRIGQAAIGVTTVAFVVILTGAEPSVMRAGTMATLALLGVLLAKPRSTAVVLSGAVFVLLVVDPSLVRQVGFQLSVAATAGMVALANPLGERFTRAMPAPVALAAATTCSAQLGVTPILLFHFHDIPVVTIPANVVAAPTVAPSLLLGLVAASVGVVSEPLGRLVALAAQVPMKILQLVANVGGRAPIAHITSRGGVAVLLIGGAIVVGFTVALRTGWRPPRRAVVLAVAALPLLVWTTAVSKGPPSSLTVRVFDVGQGDAALVTTPAGASILIDGGPDEEQVATELAALGVKRLDVVVASHPHADHIVGVPAVLARFQVGVVMHPGCPTTSALQVELDRAIADEGIPVRTPAAGDVFVVGDVRIDVLSPDRCWRNTESDTNNDALVLRVSQGDAVVLFATEPEEPAQEVLLDAGVDLTADVLKVPHHGAATSLPEFFEAVRADVAIVPVGENTYGHPVPSILDAIEASGSEVWRTDQRGTVTVVFGADGPVATGTR
ncbi:MAG TPA: DNA internalization-related competence protein ComEC/Rec2 [Actinomycetota bacterium]|nr:DNA internalization-related competence protein ComEC/Rec2 [Actinomycetota bacterium]